MNEYEKKMSFWIDQETRQKLEALAELNERDMSKVIRFLVKDAWAKTFQPQPAPTQPEQN